MQVWLIDFGFSEVAASDLLLATDVAELLASSSLCVGPERAVAHAAAGRRPTRRWRGRSTGSTRGRSSGATRTALKARATVCSTTLPQPASTDVVAPG